MKTKDRAETIRKQMRSAGTYREAFEPTIMALSEILDQRDNAYRDFLESGAEIVIDFTSDRGSTNKKKNPRLQAWEDLNEQALRYWRECGLTPAGLKRLNEQALKGKPRISFDAVIREICGELEE